MEENQKKNNELKAEGAGKSIAEAEADALNNLEKISSEFDLGEVEFEVLEEGSKGFFGVGSNSARVVAHLSGKAPEAETPKAEAAAQQPEPEEPVLEEEEKPEAEPLQGAEEAAQRLREYLERVIDAFGLEAAVDISEDEEALVGNVSGDDLGLFIGRHGQTIDAVQYLGNVISFRGLGYRKRVIVDAEDYRERRIDALHSLAERAVDEIESGEPYYEMKPMSAAERRIVHLYLQDREGIETASEGKEPFRYVTISRAEE